MAKRQPLLIDVSRLIWRAWSGRHVTGIDRVCLAYLRQYGSRAQAVVMTARVRRILPPAASAALFDVIQSDRDRFRARFVAWLARYGLAFAAREQGHGRLCLNIGHTGLDRPGLIQWYKDLDIEPVHFIHDLIPITHPQYCRSGEAERHRARMTAALTSATGLIANSEATVESVRAYAAETGLEVAPIVAAWLGVEDWLDDCEPSPGPTNPAGEFVVLGTIEARKNHRLLIDVWRRLAASGGNVPTLHIVGQRGWEVEDVLDALDHDERIRPFVLEHRQLDDGGLRDLLRRASALLFPSLVEGYGLPMVEAMAMRVPVIASDLPVFREIGRGIPTFLDPTDANGWQQTIRAFAAPASVERERQVEALRAYSAPSWEGHFAIVGRFLAGLPARNAEAVEN